jgi:aldose sugar dehydrogenase
MRLRVVLIALVLAAGSVSGCIDHDRQTDEQDLADEPQTENGPTKWEVPSAFPVQVRALPHGDVLVSSLDGQIFLYHNNGTLQGTVKDIDVQGFSGEYGLLGMAVHPAYPEPDWIYVFYTVPGVGSPQGGATEQHIARFTLAPGSLEPGPLEVIVELPASPVCCHNGGRLAFGADGMLYASLGDLVNAPRAQVPLDEAGSILRYTPDGGLPDDNPYPDSPVVVTGIRNAFGLFVDEELGIVVTDNGPSVIDGPPGYDQIYILQIGDNAGWPLAYGDDSFPGRTDPIWHSGDRPIAPTGVHVPRGSTMPEWDDKILFCNWNTDEAMLLDPTQGAPEPEIVFDQCRFDVTQDRDGRILIAGENTIWVFG